MTDFARGDLLRQLREARHLSQEAAGQQMGFTGKTVRSWEHGKPIKWSNAKRVARFYEVDPEEIVTRSVEDDAKRLLRVERKLDLLLEHLGLDYDVESGVVIEDEGDPLVRAARAAAGAARPASER